MRIRTVGRHAKEGFKNLFRNGWMTFAAVGAVAVTLFILGAAIALSLNVQNMSISIENELQINAYVSDSVTVKQLPELRKTLADLPGVRSVSFVSKAQALRKMEKVLQSNANLISGLGNPLPNEFVVQATDPRQTAALAFRVQHVKGVEQVQYGKSIIGKLLAVTAAVRDTAIIFIGALLVMGIFLISNTIKITIFTRRREIEIMKLVGATDGFIRGPFFVEGTLMGVFGALLPSAVLYGLYNWLMRSVTLFPPFTLLPADAVVWRVFWVLILCGVFIGAWGSVMSMRRFLRV
ncbi:MAG: permease-like cell division protein FtsX [Firmicutes bacterium]|nr:permease-like cell division protein FtsX [Bacillota bacterium]